MDVEPARILFFDDNASNVDSARRLGMRSQQVSGADQLRRALLEMGMLD